MLQEFAVIGTGNNLDSDEFADALFESTGGDASLELDRHAQVATIWFDREALSLRDAITEAVSQLRRLPFNIHSVELDDYVTQDQIADRIGMSRQAVSMHVNGLRGIRHFPLPAVGIPDHVRVWRLEDIYEYFGRPAEASRLRDLRNELEAVRKEARL